MDEKGCPADKRPESQSLLETSIKKILNHLRKGGELDAFVPNDNEEVADDEEDNQVEVASNLINEFRHKKLEFNKEDILKLLEHFDLEDQENDEE